MDENEIHIIDYFKVKLKEKGFKAYYVPQFTNTDVFYRNQQEELKAFLEITTFLAVIFTSTKFCIASNAPSQI
mgnify:CR=1 FL=1